MWLMWLRHWRGRDSAGTLRPDRRAGRPRRAATVALRKFDAAWMMSSFGRIRDNFRMHDGRRLRRLGIICRNRSCLDALDEALSCSPFSRTHALFVGLFQSPKRIRNLIPAFDANSMVLTSEESSKIHGRDRGSMQITSTFQFRSRRNKFITGKT